MQRLEMRFQSLQRYNCSKYTNLIYMLLKTLIFYILRSFVLIIYYMSSTVFYTFFILFVIFRFHCTFTDSFLHIFSKLVIYLCLHLTIFLTVLLNIPFYGEKVQSFIGDVFLKRHLPGQGF